MLYNMLFGYDRVKTAAPQVKSILNTAGTERAYSSLSYLLLSYSLLFIITINVSKLRDSSPFLEDLFRNGGLPCGGSSSSSTSSTTSSSIVEVL